MPLLKYSLLLTFALSYCTHALSSLGSHIKCTNDNRTLNLEVVEENRSFQIIYKTIYMREYEVLCTKASYQSSLRYITFSCLQFKDADPLSDVSQRQITDSTKLVITYKSFMDKSSYRLEGILSQDKRFPVRPQNFHFIFEGIDKDTSGDRVKLTLHCRA